MRVVRFYYCNYCFIGGYCHSSMALQIPKGGGFCSIMYRCGNVRERERERERGNSSIDKDAFNSLVVLSVEERSGECWIQSCIGYWWNRRRWWDTVGELGKKNHSRKEQMPNGLANLRGLKLWILSCFSYHWILQVKLLILASILCFFNNTLLWWDARTVVQKKNKNRYNKLKLATVCGLFFMLRVKTLLVRATYVCMCVLFFFSPFFLCFIFGGNCLTFSSLWPRALAYKLYRTHCLVSTRVMETCVYSFNFWDFLICFQERTLFHSGLIGWRNGIKKVFGAFSCVLCIESISDNTINL